MKNEQTPRSLADAVKARLYPPRPGADEELVPLVAAFADACAESPEAAASARASNEMANHLLSLLETRQDKSLLKAALLALLASGRLGRQAACRFIRSGSTALEQLAPLVGTLPERLRLFLLQELLREPHEEEKPLLHWARQQLAPLASAPEGEIAAFLEALDAEGDAPNHLLRATLLSGSFPETLAARLRKRPAQHELEPLCRRARALGLRAVLRELARAAAVHAAQGSPPATAVVRLLASALDPEDPTPAKAFQSMLSSGGEQAALAGLEGLARLSWPKAGRALALLHGKFPALRPRLAVKAATLPHSALCSCLAALPANQRQDFLARIFAVAASLDPDTVQARLAEDKTQDPAEAKSLASYTAGRKKAALAGIKRRTMPPSPAGPLEAGAPGLLGRLFKKKEQTFAEAVEAALSPKDRDFPGAEFSGALTSRSLTRLGLAGAWFSRAQFIKVSFSAVDFSRATFQQADFTGCTFTNCVFSGAILLSAVFAECEFRNCDFTETALEDCAFDQGRMERSFLSGALLKSVNFSGFRMEHVSFNQCQLQECVLTSTRMVHCALSHSQLLGCRMEGAELSGFCAVRSALVHTDIRCASCSHATYEDCFFLGSDADAGAFELARLAHLMAAAEALEAAPPKPPPSLPPGLAAACADLFARRLDISRQVAALLANNQRRLELCLKRMAGVDCFRLVPYLLHTDLMEQLLGIEAPPCRLAGYTPGPTAMDIASRTFKGFAPTPPRGQPVLIQGLYAMGSVGSVAQTRSSDVDYWVCYDAATASPEALSGLRAKLDAITAWSMENHGLEVYFFLMSMDDVRANAFGFSDKESSGSAQAILLKEEFYRTVLPVAGMLPAWWAAPAGCTAKAARAWLGAARTFPRQGQPRFVDMGHLTPIPRDEFFGASLWQIVKALRSPYKSVMKLGLLEKYSSHPEGLMLADRIKRGLLLGRRAVQDADPYVALFRELRDYYREVKDADTVRLLTEALLLKAKVGEYDFLFGFPAGQEEYSLLEFLFGPGKATAARVKNLGHRWSFAKSMQIGSTVSRFMTATYKRIQARLGAGAEGGRRRVRITPEDMTRLGRQIAANFAVRRHKIMRVPFLGDLGYHELHFLAEKAPGKPTIWAVQGKGKAEGKRSVKRLEPIFRAATPATLFAWLVVNRLFNRSTLVDGEATIAPLSAPDIKNFLARLHATLPHGEVFEPEPDAYLDDERVTRAVILVNLLAPADANKIVSLDVIYATNWGEVYCQPGLGPDKLLQKDTRAWLARELAHDCTLPREVAAVYPKRAQCPRLRGL
jgi:adenylate cyclase class 1